MAVPLRPRLQRPARRGRRRTGGRSRDPLTLHGRIANLPAHFVEVRVSLDPPYELSVIGQVEEAGLFFPHLLLTTTYTTVPGSNRLVIHDLVENRAAPAGGDAAALSLQPRPAVPGSGQPGGGPDRGGGPATPRAAEGIDTFETYAGPTAGFAEQVYCYDLLADAAGRTLALLYNAAADRGPCPASAHRNELPCFTVWKNTAPWRTAT